MCKDLKMVPCIVAHVVPWYCSCYMFSYDHLAVFLARVIFYVLWTLLSDLFWYGHLFCPLCWQIIVYLEWFHCCDCEHAMLAVVDVAYICMCWIILNLNHLYTHVLNYSESQPEMNKNVQQGCNVVSVQLCRTLNLCSDMHVYCTIFNNYM